MKGKDKKDNQENKEYPTSEGRSFAVREPEVMYETRSEIDLFEEDFNKAMTTAINMEDLRLHLYRVIDDWQWKKE
jgi:hypothetical protein